MKNPLQILLNYKHRFLFRRKYLKPDIELKATWLGNTHAGFFVSLPELNNSSVIYSIGIGEDTSFDAALIARTGCRVYGFDPTPKAIRWVAAHPLSNFIFSPVGISNRDGEEVFFLPKNENYVSGSIIQLEALKTEGIKVQMKTLASLMKQHQHTAIDLLKIDIEGSEYMVIDEFLASGIYPKQLCIEFHHRMLPNGEHQTTTALQKLKAAGYKLFASSASGEEVSFVLC